MFYKNKHGEVAREVQENVVKEIKASGWDPKEQDRLDTVSKAG